MDSILNESDEAAQIEAEAQRRYEEQADTLAEVCYKQAALSCNRTIHLYDDNLATCTDHDRAIAEAALTARFVDAWLQLTDGE